MGFTGGLRGNIKLTICISLTNKPKYSWAQIKFYIQHNEVFIFPKIWLYNLENQ